MENTPQKKNIQNVRRKREMKTLRAAANHKESTKRCNLGGKKRSRATTKQNE